MAVVEAEVQLREPIPKDRASIPPLSLRAIELLQIASNSDPENVSGMRVEHSIWQPDSYLMQGSWKALAEQGAGEQALSVAMQQELRNPLAYAQALHEVSILAKAEPALCELVARELETMHIKLFEEWVISDATRQTERLILAAASAVNIGDKSLALSYLERLDQIERGWDRVILRVESRTILASTISAIGLHPLISYLITTSVRRHEEAGAEFLHQIVSHLKPDASTATLPRRSARLLRKCVETFQFATLSSLNSRRLAALAFGQAGMVSHVLAQITTMANVQEARRVTGQGSTLNDPQLLRQVTRPNANPDVDFQIYTLQQAISAMPIRAIPREDRIKLANRLAELAVLSDGWTAAGASSTLVNLGALRYAVDVVDNIPAADPTRSEGVLSLVNALLMQGSDQQAREQVDKALAWLKENAGQNAERATIWGIADAYLEHGQPEMALYLLEQRREDPSFGGRVRRWMRPGWTDDQLRDNRIRLSALLASENALTQELQILFDELCQWAPMLLEGETLIAFYLDGMLPPLLAAGYNDKVLYLLPALRDALASSAGDKHELHVHKAAKLLAQMVDHGEADVGASDGATDGASSAESNAALHHFLEALWADDASKGLWQTVHAVEGSMPLLYALEGPQALVTIAESAANEGSLWIRE